MKCQFYLQFSYVLQAGLKTVNEWFRMDIDEYKKLLL